MLNEQEICLRCCRYKTVNAEHKAVTVIGGGVAGMSAACALAEAGFRVQLMERRGYLGGRAVILPPSRRERGHRQLPACPLRLLHQSHRLLSPHRRRKQNPLDQRDDDDRARRTAITNWALSCALPAPLHGLPKLLSAHAFSLG